MPSPDDRLQELRRQHALVQEHLAWLDREIASASGQAMPADAARQSQPTAAPAEGVDPHAIIESFKAESRSTPVKAFWGCIWIFVAALVIFALCVFALYHYVSTHQPPVIH